MTKYAHGSVRRAENMGLGSNGGGHDFYATHPEDAARVFELADIRGKVWEPAAGTGEMAEVLRTARGGRKVRTSDVVDRGYPLDAVADFLDSGSLPAVWGRSRPDWVVTNPPFRADFAEAFVRRGFDVAQRGVAVIARLAWLEGERRGSGLFTERPPSVIGVFSKRPRFRPGESQEFVRGMIAFAWYVWDFGAEGPTRLFWL